LRRSAAIAAIAALAFLVNACTGDSASGEPEPSLTGAGQASGELVAWMEARCQAVNVPMRAAATARGPRPETTVAPAELATSIAAMLDYAHGEEAIYRDASTRLAALDPPPIDGGDVTLTQLAGAYEGAANGWAAFADEVTAFDATADGAAAAWATMTAEEALSIVVEFSTDYRNAIGTADSKRWMDAELTAPSCQGVL
jgi:hypothetical protein